MFNLKYVFFSIKLVQGFQSDIMGTYDIKKSLINKFF